MWDPPVLCVIINCCKGTVLELNLLLLAMENKPTFILFYIIINVIVTDGNVPRSDVIDPFYCYCYMYWPDVIVPICFILHLLVHDIKEQIGTITSGQYI